MIVIYCQSPINPKQPDEMYEAEAEAARSAGLAIRLIDFEALVHEGNIEKALRSVPSSESRLPAVFRGWMMTPETYEVLFKALTQRGVYLVNEPAEYKHCHNLPEWQAEFGASTPETVVVPMSLGQDLSAEQLCDHLTRFGKSAIIVKDFVKSEKHYWEEACFIPDASDSERALKVVQRFLQLRGSDLQGGLVFRRFVQFRNLGVHPKSGMPLTEEYRAFVLNGKIVSVMHYWDEVEYPEAKPNFDELLSMVAGVRSQFFTVDFARLQSGDWMIVELGDGQVAGLPDNADMSLFYRAFEDIERARGGPQIRARIRMYETTDGGQRGRLNTEIRCPMKIEGKDEALHDCRIELDERTVGAGETFEANVEFLCPALVAPWLMVGMRFQLWMGEMFAEGETIEVLRVW